MAKLPLRATKGGIDWGFYQICMMFLWCFLLYFRGGRKRVRTLWAINIGTLRVINKTDQYRMVYAVKRYFVAE